MPKRDHFQLPLHFVKNPFAIVFVLIVVGAGSWVALSGAPISPYQTVTVEAVDLTQTVSVTGTVRALDSADLSFAVGGRIASVPARVGDRVGRGQVLVTLENGDVMANLEQSTASLAAAQAQLDELIRGARPEEIAVTEAKVASGRQALTSAIQSAYAAADAAIQVELDQFISNPHGASPQLSFPTTDSSMKTAVESGRVAVEAPLKKLREHVTAFTASSSDAALSPKSLAVEAQSVLQQVASLLASAAAALNRAIPTGTVSQATIDSYAASIATARASVANEISAVSAAITTLDTAESTLALEKAGADPQDIASQRATVNAAAARVAADKALLAKTVLVAPFSGVVTRQDAKVGQVVGQTVGSSLSLVTLMSSQGFEIETFVPEADIAKVHVGDSARVTLDAYGEDVLFSGTVSSIDPAETVIEGVSTYKVKLSFTSEPEPPRSGMTANVDIETASRPAVLAVPARAVSERDGKKSLKVLKMDGSIEEREVTIGLAGSDGRIEITSGLRAGEKVVIYSAK